MDDIQKSNFIQGYLGGGGRGYSKIVFQEFSLLQKMYIKIRRCLGFYSKIEGF